MRLHARGDIDRPVADVFRFYADDHVKNHPRWDPAVELKAVSDGPIGVGSVIHRRVRRFGTVVEGTMTVTEFERDRAVAMEIHDGPATMTGRATFEAIAPGRTRLTMDVDAPAIEDRELAAKVEKMMEGSIDNIRRLMAEE